MKRALKWAATGMAALLLLGIGLLWIADTSIGHRLIADQIAAQAPKSGLKIRIGRIEGSIYGKARLRSLRLYDPAGLFFEAPMVTLDWSPLRWFDNALVIRELRSDMATLYKRPALRAGSGRQPMLPGFDIHIDSVAIKRLIIESPVTGMRQSGRASARIDIAAGRALANIDLRTSAGDSMILRLDALPDRDRFDLASEVAAPAGGMIGALAGIAEPLAITIKGNGSWRVWSGTVQANSDTKKLADIALSNREGVFSIDGKLMPGTLTPDRWQRLAGPLIGVSGQATLSNRKVTGGIQLRSSALAISAKGRIDLAANRYDGVMVTATLLDSPALFAAMSGTPLRLSARLDGSFATARFDYLLEADRISFGTTGFVKARVSGQGRLSPAPMTIPVRLTAAQVTGVGNVAGGILANLQVAGDLKVDRRTLAGAALRLSSDRLTSRFDLMVDLRTGRYDISFNGALERYVIPGLGVVDVRSQLSLVPGGASGGTILAGRGQAWVRRLDNRFLASLTKGLPRVEADLVRGSDGILRFNRLRLIAPGLQLVGTGLRRRDGSFAFEASGSQSQYGRISRLTLDGRIDRPRIDLALAAPNAALGLAAVRLRLDPDASGYAWQAQGGSSLGDFTGAGTIALPTGAPATIAVTSLDVAGMRANGRLISREAGLDGQLMVSGNGVSGTITLSPDQQVQRIEARVAARNSRFASPLALAVRRAQLDAIVHLDPGSSRIEATVSGQELVREGITLSRFAANMRLRGGRGDIRASAAGSRGIPFDLQSVAKIAPDMIELVGSGTLDRKPVRIEDAARLMRTAGGWRLDPTTFAFAGGRILASGQFGGKDSEIEATLSQLPLSSLDLVAPQLGLGGIANGRISYRSAAGTSPTGKADIRVRGLTRAGLILASTPVDVGISAILAGNNAAARAVAASGGKTIGRAQIRLTPGDGPDLSSRLRRAPVFAQIRYSGAADTLWRLTGVEALDLSGPVAIGADISGTLDDPKIIGSLRTVNARIESAVTGMVLTAVKAGGRFDGSRLILDEFSGMSGKEGRISGSGTIDLSSSRGFGMAIDVKADQARLIVRDELSATVSGPISIRSDAGGGLISGDIVLDRGSYRLGRAAAAVAAIAQLDVSEVNNRSDIARPRQRAPGWRLAIKAKAPGRISVSGLGIDSEWRARLDIVGTATAPVISGQADLIRGSYEFAGRQFDLTRGAIRFDGESPPDPALDISASGNTQGLTASIRVGGTGLRPDISFSSTPALPQDELLSRLLFGTSITNLSAPEAVQLASAVASLRGGATDLNPINALRNAIGLDRLRILPADTTTGQRTSIAAGKYLTRRIYFEVITDGQGYSATRAEFQITRWLSILSTISNIGRQSATVRVSKDY